MNIDENKITDWIKENTMIDGGLTSQNMSMYSLKEILTKFHNSELNQLSLGSVMLSFTDDEQRTQFIEETIICNKQNLNGRETEDEIYEAGVCAGFDDLLEKLNEA